MTKADKKKKDKLRTKAPAPTLTPTSLWAPAAIFPAVAFFVIFKSLSTHDFAHYAYFVQDSALKSLAETACMAAAILALIPPCRHLAIHNLESLTKMPSHRRAAMLSLAVAGLSAWWCFIRYCEYRAYLLPTDTTIEIQNAYVFLHSASMYLPLWGMNQLSQHIYLLMPVLCPALLLWNNPLVILLLYHIFLCSVPFAAYAIAVQLTESSLAGTIALLLAVSAPSLYELLQANIDVGPLVAFFLWAMFFLRRRQWVVTILFFGLMITCKEQVPFIFAGLGLYVIHALRERKPWNWAAALVICAAAAGLWWLEIAVMRHYEALEPELHLGTTKWQMFAHMVAAGTPSNRILHEILVHPVRNLEVIFSSPYKFYPLLRVLFSMGFLCLLAPWQMLPFAAAFLPHFLSNPGTPCAFFDYHPITYFDLGMHHPSYMLGPLVWASTYGIARAYRWLAARGKQGWLLVWSLLFCSLGFRYAHRSLNPQWRTTWFDAMPRVQALIPPQARVWGDEYALAPLSVRRWLKNIRWGPGMPEGWESLFKPDYALFDKAFVVVAKPPYRDQMLTFFAQNHFEKIADDSNVLLLKSPGIPSSEDQTPEWIHLPPADPQLVQSYGRYLLGGR